ncbi:MAG: hypothetical protein L3J57_03765 [Desulfuromusa sp.]|nr:hypothetical protein [Desulfuromusa sp.]
MFIQHKQLKKLNIPAEKVEHLHSVSSSVQLAFAGYPPQLCRAYLLKISGGDKVLIVVAFYLAESQCSIFFVPKFGELPAEDADPVYEEGYSFVESMGFVLTETDYHLLSRSQKQAYWIALPICQPAKKKEPEESATTIKANEELKKLRLQSRKSLGRFFASM